MFRHVLPNARRQKKQTDKVVKCAEPQTNWTLEPTDSFVTSIPISSANYGGEEGAPAVPLAQVGPANMSKSAMKSEVAQSLTSRSHHIVLQRCYSLITRTAQYCLL